MKKSQVIPLHNFFYEAQTLKGKSDDRVKFFYNVKRNIQKLQPEALSIQDAIKPSDKIGEYNKKRVEICENLSKKDENGKAIIENEIYITLFTDNTFKTKIPKFEEALNKLDEEYKEALSEHEEHKKKVMELLNEDIEFDLYKFKLDIIPKDASSEFIDAIFELIIE